MWVVKKCKGIQKQGSKFKNKIIRTDNKIGEGGGKMISEILKMNSTLTTLNVSGEMR